jgi:hypothetical protein
MSTLRLTKEQLLEELRQLGSHELTQLKSYLVLLLAEQKEAHLGADETELLTRINRGLATEQVQRYRELLSKRDQQTLSLPEHRELLALSDQAEQKQVERVKLLDQLAQLRGVGLSDLIEQLGLKPLAHA